MALAALLTPEVLISPIGGGPAINSYVSLPGGLIHSQSHELWLLSLFWRRLPPGFVEEPGKICVPSRFYWSKGQSFGNPGHDTGDDSFRGIK